MGLAWRGLLALLGLYWLRNAVYEKQWGHGGLVKSVITGGVGLLVIAPLWRFSEAAHPWMIGVGAVALFPYRQVLLGHLQRIGRKGAAAIAAEWGALVDKDDKSDLVTVRRPPSGEISEAWVGNVLTHVRSLHPAVLWVLPEPLQVGRKPRYRVPRPTLGATMTRATLLAAPLLLVAPAQASHVVPLPQTHVIR